MVPRESELYSVIELYSVSHRKNVNHLINITYKILQINMTLRSNVVKEISSFAIVCDADKKPIDHQLMLGYQLPWAAAGSSSFYWTKSELKVTWKSSFLPVKLCISWQKMLYNIQPKSQYTASITPLHWCTSFTSHWVSLAMFAWAQDSNCLFHNKIPGNIQRRWNHMCNNCCITWYDTDVLNIHLNIHSPYD